MKRINHQVQQSKNSTAVLPEQMQHAPNRISIHSNERDMYLPAANTNKHKFGNMPLYGAHPFIQAKLQVNDPGDEYEQEADNIADKIMGMTNTGLLQAKPVSVNTIQRKCSACEKEEGTEEDKKEEQAENIQRSMIQRKCAACEEEEEKLQRKPDSTNSTPAKESKSGNKLPVSPALNNSISTSRGRGGGMDANTLNFMSDRFGADFSKIKIHTDSEATRMSQQLNAKAFTVGRDIYFNEREYNPSTKNGKRLLAHELTHTLQQGAAPSRTIQRKPGDFEDPIHDYLLDKFSEETGIPRDKVNAHSAEYQKWLHDSVAPKPTPLPAKTPNPGPGDFLIDRISKSNTSQIFFARGQSAVSAEALLQIDAIKAAAPTAGVGLIGFASADETPAIASARADAVKAALIAAPNPVKVNSTKGNAPATANRSNFSGARFVEIVVGTNASATLDCKALDSNGNPVNPPRQTCATMDPDTLTAFNIAQPLAVDAMKRAIDAADASKGTFNPDLVDRFFGKHDAATLATLATNLANLSTHVGNLPNITDCGGQCDAGSCDTGSVIAYNQNVDAASTMTLCVPTFKGMHINDQVRNLIHESAHGTTPLGGTPSDGTRDVAYRHERMLFQLSTADRLRNSDSYALFALFIKETETTKNPAAVPAGISTPSNDTFNGFTDAAEQTALKVAMAKLEKRLTWATDWSGQLFGQLIGAMTSGWAGSWAEDLMITTASMFPLTAPPAKPTQTDKIRLAAIGERYKIMKAAVKRDLTITRVNAGVVNWPSGAMPGDSFEIGPDFFMATPDNQVSILLENLAKATGGVEAAYVPAYVSLAKWIHNQNP